MSEDDSEVKPSNDREIQKTFHRTVDEGTARLDRPWSGLLATGTVGGFDVGIGLLAALVVLDATGSRLLAALAFTIGFIALVLGKSELFTENFLVPVVTTVARRRPVRPLVRLWFGTGVSNLAAGWVLGWIIIGSLPHLEGVAIEAALLFAHLPVPIAFGLGILGGIVITLMTWLEHGSQTEGGRILSAAMAGFLFEAVPLNHFIITSLIMFWGIHAGGPLDYLDWLRIGGIALVSNIIGGIVLVTALRLMQIGGEEIHKEQARPRGARREADGVDEER
ncbi:MAG: formate/nitrite transporter family protein [Euryarchaeota archaeon]|nr:formate/nitrite transporter family protein [Euryarchaeota archaeon]